MSISELEEIGLQIIALIRAGEMESFQCSKCDSHLQAERNCKGDVDFPYPVYAHKEIGEFYVCPMLMIPKSVFDWLGEYDYYEKYPSSAPLYDDVNPRFWMATKFFEQFKYTLEQEKKKDDKPSSQDNMSKMASLFNKG